MAALRRPLKILFASAECAPFAQCGGLADVSRDLPLALAARGHDVRVALPWYDAVPARRLAVETVGGGSVEFAGRAQPYRVGRFAALAVPVYLVQHATFTRQMYGGLHDELGLLEQHRRFWFFCRALKDLIARWGWAPDVVHANDHATAALLVELAEAGHSASRVLTVHNAFCQGSFFSDRLTAENRDDPSRPMPAETRPRARFVNFLQRGLLAADRVTTVSRRYARDLSTPAGGEGLDPTFRLIGDRLTGIVNGVDVGRYDPRSDAALPRRYGPGELRHRAASKRALQQLCGLPRRDVPVAAFAARLCEQKGLPLLLEAAPELLGLGVQLVVHGDGDARFVDGLRALAAAHPAQVSWRPWSHAHETLYYAGADLFLMPSKWEPCGLGQLKALRYGAVPVVAATGGLRETVPASVGFQFGRHTRRSFVGAVHRALALYRSRPSWRRLQQAGMAVDASWHRLAAAYERVYRLAGGDALARLKRAAR